MTTFMHFFSWLALAASVVGCHSEKTPSPTAPQDANASLIATTSAAPPAPSSSPFLDASIDASLADASTLSDAFVAGSHAWRVLVPKSVAENSGSDDPLDAIAHAVASEVSAARADRASPSPVVLYADTTIDYGCVCPPFVFAPFWNSGRPDSTFLPVYAPGVPEPPLAKQGLYRFVGRFDGRAITGFDWLKMRGGKIEEGMEEYAQTSPVLVVEGWCFEPNASFSDPDLESVYKKTLARMEKDGRFCPGTHMPAHAAPPRKN